MELPVAIGQSDVDGRHIRLNGLKAPISRPEKGSITLGILVLFGYSSGAKALRYCISEPILTVAGTKGHSARRRESAGHGEIGVILQRQLAAFHRAAQAIGEAENFQRRKSAFGFGDRAGRREQIQLLAIAVKNRVQVPPSLA